MTIIEAIQRLRDDLRAWVKFNLDKKVDKTFGVEDSGKFLVVDDNGEVKAGGQGVKEINRLSTFDDIASAKSVYDFAVPVIRKSGYDTVYLSDVRANATTATDATDKTVLSNFVRVSGAKPTAAELRSGIKMRFTSKSAFESIDDIDSKIVHFDEENSGDILFTNSGVTDGSHLFVIITKDNTIREIDGIQLKFETAGLYLNTEVADALQIQGYTGFSRRIINPDFHPDVLSKVLPSDCYGTIENMPAPGVPGRFFFVLSGTEAT